MQGGDYMRYLREKLLEAKHEVFITDLKMVLDIELVRGDAKQASTRGLETLFDILKHLARKKVKVYIALWGSRTFRNNPFKKIGYGSEEVMREIQEWNKNNTNITAIQACEHSPNTLTTHHEKMVIIDRSIAQWVKSKKNQKK